MLALLLAGLLSVPSASASNSREGFFTELDVSTFQNVLLDSEFDAVILFKYTSHAEEAHELLKGLSSKIGTGSTRFYLFDVHLHGWPAGLHIHRGHDGEHSALVLFPAGAREPTRYDFSHDPLSRVDCSEAEDAADSCAAHAPDEADEHQHHHALRPSLKGSLKFLKQHSSFPADIPALTLSEVWEDRENELWQAVGVALDTLKLRLDAVVKENKALKKELQELSSKQCYTNQHCHA
jgi:hypothetical protein